MLKKRIEKLRASLPQNAEAAIIKTQENMFYLLGFDAHGAGTLLLLPDGMHYIIDSRYIEVAKNQIKNAQVILQQEIDEQILSLVQAAGVKNIYAENKISVAALSSLEKALPNVEIISNNTLSKALDEQRAIKDEEEISRMRAAQKITDDCFTHILSFIKEGVREIDLALEMEHYMRSHGAEGIAFDTICVAGAKTSLPHGVPGENQIKNGNFITMDFGAKYKGYCADMTRTVCFGTPNEEQKRIYDITLQAHKTAMQAVKAGVTGVEIDKIARDIIYSAGYEGCFGHGLGHSLGIEVHEEPRFSPKAESIIKAGMLLSVEPGIYLEGKYGCRIEDVVLVTENGCEALPVSNKELIIL